MRRMALNRDRSSRELGLKKTCEPEVTINVESLSALNEALIEFVHLVC